MIYGDNITEVTLRVFKAFVRMKSNTLKCPKVAKLSRKHKVPDLAQICLDVGFTSCSCEVVLLAPHPAVWWGPCMRVASLFVN